MKSFTAVLASSKKTVELHATGCRDLAGIKAAKRVIFAEGYAQVIRPARIHEVAILAYPCCAAKRMAAAGRGDIGAPVVVASETVAESIAE